MLGIDDMFRELDGYDRYEVSLAAWGAIRRADEREYHRERYQDPAIRANTLAYARAWREAKRRRQGIPARRVPEHGEYSKYTGGCRCDLCRAASANYRRERRQRLKEAA